MFHSIAMALPQNEEVLKKTNSDGNKIGGGATVISNKDLTFLFQIECK